jgi:hypothetical protein
LLKKKIKIFETKKSDLVFKGKNYEIHILGFHCCESKTYRRMIFFFKLLNLFFWFIARFGETFSRDDHHFDFYKTKNSFQIFYNFFYKKTRMHTPLKRNTINRPSLHLLHAAD